MPVTADALNTATEHLLPKLEDLFWDEHPLLKRMVDNGVDKRKSGGEYAAFVVVTQGPGNVVKLLNGSEAYSYGRRNITRQGRVYIPTHIYAYGVEGEALRHAHGETGIANLLELYPEKANRDFRQMSVAQILSGNGATNNIDGLATFNGNTTYNPDGGPLNGVFDFAAPAAQNQTVFNLPKQGATTNPVQGWANQFGSVSSFATDGKSTMRTVYNECLMRSGGHGPPDLGLTDSTSFNNYYESLDDQVRYATKFEGEAGRDILEGLMFHNMEVFTDPSLEDNLSAEYPAQNGVMFMVNTKTWFILTLGGDSDMETKGFFDLRGPYKLEGRDAWGWELVSSWQMACRYLRANGVLQGTATV